MTFPTTTDFRTKTPATPSIVTFHNGKTKIRVALTPFQTIPTASRETIMMVDRRRSEIRLLETRVETTDFQTIIQMMMTQMEEVSSLRKISKTVNNLATTREATSRAQVCPSVNLIPTRTMDGLLATLLEALMPEINSGATITMATTSSREAGDWLARSSADASKPPTTHQRDI